MNDIRRTILLVIFGFSLVMLWDQWQVHNGNKPTFLPSRTTQPAPPAAGNATTSANAANGALPAAAGSTASAAAVPTQGAPAAAGEKVKITTDVFSAVIDGQGGTLSELQLREYDEQTNNGGLVETFHRLIGNLDLRSRLKA